VACIWHLAAVSRRARGAGVQGKGAVCAVEDERGLRGVRLPPPSAEPFRIVRPTCGCTAPVWWHGPVQTTASSVQCRQRLHRASADNGFIGRIRLVFFPICWLDRPKLLGNSVQARLGDSTLRECLTIEDGPKSRTHDSITSSTTLLRKKLPARFSARAPHPKL
jgi:hypothetical protein